MLNYNFDNTDFHICHSVIYAHSGSRVWLVLHNSGYPLGGANRLLGQAYNWTKQLDQSQSYRYWLNWLCVLNVNYTASQVTPLFTAVSQAFLCLLGSLFSAGHRFLSAAHTPSADLPSLFPAAPSPAAQQPCFWPAHLFLAGLLPPFAANKSKNEHCHTRWQ